MGVPFQCQLVRESGVAFEPSKMGALAAHRERAVPAMPPPCEQGLRYVSASRSIHRVSILNSRAKVSSMFTISLALVSIKPYPLPLAH